MENQLLSILSLIGHDFTERFISPGDLKLIAEEVEKLQLMTTAKHLKGRNHDLVEIKVMLFHNKEKA